MFLAEEVVRKARAGQAECRQNSGHGDSMETAARIWPRGSTAEEEPMPDRTLIAGAQVFDGSGAAPFAADVLIEGDRIAAVGGAVTPSAQADAEVVDGSGATLIPGLIDGHAHL